MELGQGIQGQPLSFTVRVPICIAYIQPVVRWLSKVLPIIPRRFYMEAPLSIRP